MGPVDNVPTLALGNGFAPIRRQAMILTNADPIHWRIYAALGGDELKLQINRYENSQHI